MITLKIACRKHPTYTGVRKPRASWDRLVPHIPCPGCAMVFDARNNNNNYKVELCRPWVRMWTVKE